MTAKKKTPKKKKNGFKNSFLMVVVCAIFVVLFKYSFIFFIAAMLPAIVANTIDRTPRNSYFKIVGGFNAAGVMPYMVELWNSNNSAEAVMTMFQTPNNWLAIYAAAALGWGIILFLPSLVLAFLTGIYRGKVNDIQDKQKKLIEEWGPEIKRG